MGAPGSLERSPVRPPGRAHVIGNGAEVVAGGWAKTSVVQAVAGDEVEPRARCLPGTAARAQSPWAHARETLPREVREVRTRVAEVVVDKATRMQEARPDVRFLRRRRREHCRPQSTQARRLRNGSL